MPEPQYTPEELVQERWLPVAVPGYEKLYSVSNIGRVRSEFGICGSRNGRILKHGLTAGGYHFVSLHNRGVKKQSYVHRLVATVFIPNPDSRRQVGHKDRDHDNNRTSNLRWATGSQNNANQSGKIKSTSKYKGVYYNSVFRCWIASAKLNGTPQRFGFFRTAEAAALAYDHATRPVYGEFAFDNSRVFGLTASVEEELEIIDRERIRKIYGTSPISDSAVIAIRLTYNASPSIATEIALSEQYGRSVSTIRDIRKGRTFKRLLPD